MAYRFTARAVPGVFDRGRSESYEVRSGSFTIRNWDDGTSRFGAPTEIDWLTAIDRLPDMIKLPYPCVSARLRDLIERFEPGVHEFYPVRVTTGNGEAEQRYLLHVVRELEAVSAEHSTWVNKDGVLWLRPQSRDERLVFDVRRIGDAHLWRNKTLRTEMNPFASDALAEAALEAGMTGLLLDHFDQTDPDGSYEPSPLSPDRVYMVYERTRLVPPKGTRSGVPLKIKTKLLDGKPNEVRFANDADGQKLALSSAVRMGRWLDPANVPTRAYYYQNVKGHAPDLFGYDQVPLTVSTRFRDLIEQFEPGRHQFLPIDFVDKKGEVTERRHILVVGALLDGWSRRRSAMLGDHGPYNPGGEQGTILIDRASVAGHHLWRDRFLTSAIFLSNELAAQVEELGWPDLAFAGYDLAD